jgi:hypothetical protein
MIIRNLEKSKGVQKLFTFGIWAAQTRLGEGLDGKNGKNGKNKNKNKTKYNTLLSCYRKIARV